MIGRYKFSERSLAQVKTMHDDLQKIFTAALYYTDIDFVVTEGGRSIARQQEMFRKGLSKIDGINKKGKHNLVPSEAGDIIAYVRGKKNLAYDVKHLTFIAGVITTVAKMLFEQGVIEHLIRWGGNWDKDGEIIYDQTFKDLPHFELYKP